MDINQNINDKPKDEKKADNIKNVAEFLIVVILAIILASVINSAVFEVTFIQQDSMYDTLYGGGDESVKTDTPFDKFFFGAQRGVPYGDKVLVLKTKKVNKGDIITFYKNMGEKGREKLVKRVIAKEGDIVDIKDGFVFVNGTKLVEDYVSGPTYALVSHIEVGKNQLYVLGDNRGVSVDSRSFGLVSLDDVIGKVTLVIQKKTKKLVLCKNL